MTCYVSGETLNLTIIVLTCWLLLVCFALETVAFSWQTRSTASGQRSLVVISAYPALSKFENWINNTQNAVKARWNISKRCMLTSGMKILWPGVNFIWTWCTLNTFDYLLVYTLVPIFSTSTFVVIIIIIIIKLFVCSVAQWLGRWTCDWRSRVQIPSGALSSATLDKLFTHIVQRLWCYNLMALYKSV